MPKTQKKAQKFPRTIQVRYIQDGQYLAVDEDQTDAENGERVAIYELRETKTKRVTHELV